MESKTNFLGQRFHEVAGYALVVLLFCSSFSLLCTVNNAKSWRKEEGEL
jgi:hypothetical protein